MIATIRFGFLTHYFNVFKGIFGLYFTWICVHYFASHLHIHFCVPPTITGFIMSPFMTATPHCQALRWVIYNGGNSIIAMWLLLGTWIVQYLKPINV